MNIFIVATVRVYNIFFRLRMEMETREGKHNEKKKENEKDVKKTYNNNKNDVICFVWLNKMAERNISHV